MRERGEVLSETCGGGDEILGLMYVARSNDLLRGFLGNTFLSSIICVS